MLTEVARHAADARPQVVVIEGEAGVGKSSLVRAAIDDLDSFTVLRADADADELATGASMWLVAQLGELDSHTPHGGQPGTSSSRVRLRACIIRRGDWSCTYAPCSPSSMLPTSTASRRARAAIVVTERHRPRTVIARPCASLTLKTPPTA